MIPKKMISLPIDLSLSTILYHVINVWSGQTPPPLARQNLTVVILCLVPCLFESRGYYSNPLLLQSSLSLGSTIRMMAAVDYCYIVIPRFYFCHLPSFG